MSAVRSVPYISALKRRSFTAPVVIGEGIGVSVVKLVDYCEANIWVLIRHSYQKTECMTIMATHNIACIGAGYWGKNLVRNFTELGALAWVCDADPRTRAQLAAAYPTARFTDAVEHVLADPAVAGVAIATPADTHSDLARRALLAGKDVLVEKPLNA